MTSVARRTVAVSILAAVIGVALPACGSKSTPTTTAAATTTTGAQVAAPVMVDQTTLDGKTVETKVGRMVVFTAADPTKWTGTVADTKVATFQAGKNDGSATFNPGLVPIAAGTTKVTVTDGTTTVTFTLVVS